MTKLQTILIPIALAVLMVAGCERVVTSTMDPEPAVPEPAVPESEPGLEGSWVQEEPWLDDGTLLGMERTVLTLTKSRYVEDRVRYTTDGEIVGQGWGQGTWSSTDNTITRVWREDDEEFRVTTQYGWGSTRDVLWMTPWFSDDEYEERYARYDRITDELRLAGTWHISWEDRAEELYQEGDQSYWLITINPDGTFIFSSQGEWDDGTLGGEELRGTWTFDQQELAMTLEVTAAKHVADGEPSDRNDRYRRFYLGHTLRARLARTDDPDILRISYWVFEQTGHWETFEDETERTDGNDQFPHGLYIMVLNRVS